MAEITAALVAKLRELTGAGRMDCRKALVEAQGNLDLALDILRKKGAVTAARKSLREAREGAIAWLFKVAAAGRVSTGSASGTAWPSRSMARGPWPLA
jgi:translation elongation factor EF-Ts